MISGLSNPGVGCEFVSPLRSCILYLRGLVFSEAGEVDPCLRPVFAGKPYCSSWDCCHFQSSFVVLLCRSVHGFTPVLSATWLWISSLTIRWTLIFFFFPSQRPANYYVSWCLDFFCQCFVIYRSHRAFLWSTPGQLRWTWPPVTYSSWRVLRIGSQHKSYVIVFTLMHIVILNNIFMLLIHAKPHDGKILMNILFWWHDMRGMINGNTRECKPKHIKKWKPIKCFPSCRMAKRPTVV